MVHEELKSMRDNDVWELVDLPNNSKPIGCKLVFKFKTDSRGNVERFKASLVAKEFTQRDGLNLKIHFYGSLVRIYSELLWH